jgi:hypothetical protein
LGDEPGLVVGLIRRGSFDNPKKSFAFDRLNHTPFGMKLTMV